MRVVLQLSASAAKTRAGQGSPAPRRRLLAGHHPRRLVTARVFDQLAGSLWGSPTPAAPAEPAQKTRRVELEDVEAGPAPTDVWAEPLAGDSEDVAPLRPMLAATQLEKAPLQLAYDADRDGWSADAFHGKVDGAGAAVVVALTAGGAVLGGYNPSGWSTSGAAKNDIAAFLFVWPEGDVSERPIKLPRVGGVEESVVRDEAGQGIYFGPDGITIPLAPGNERFAKSKLGAYYARRPNGGRHLFTEGSPVRGSSRGTQLVSLRVYVAASA